MFAKPRKVGEMFPTARTIPLFATRGRAEAVETWRAAAARVATSWHVFLESEPDCRAWAFACYVAALDAEEAAAWDLSALSSSLAA
jgi:hypothetical protein